MSISFYSGRCDYEQTSLNVSILGPNLWCKLVLKCESVSELWCECDYSVHWTKSQIQY